MPRSDATDRPISYWETVNRPRVSDYPFTFIELRLNKDGDGVGKLAIAAKNLRTGKVASVNRSTRVPLMSVMKLPVALVALGGALGAAARYFLAVKLYGGWGRLPLGYARRQRTGQLGVGPGGSIN